MKTFMLCLATIVIAVQFVNIQAGGASPPCFGELGQSQRGYDIGGYAKGHAFSSSKFQISNIFS
jgi:hypothetical protein